jgi:hypothetical protein
MCAALQVRLDAEDTTKQNRRTLRKQIAQLEELVEFCTI